MLRMDGKNVNFNGVSIVNDAQIATMNASSSNNSVYFNFSIENVDTYKANIDAVNTDMEDFRDAVIEAI